ncbi:MAG: hypothetical protein U1F15_08205 [Burkholderiales bacterium]
MLYEPDTVWGRTVQGDREIAQPKSGLSLAQRKVLKKLGNPRTLATLAATHKIDPPKLEHELLRLAQMQLVAFQRPGSSQPRTAPRIDLPLPAQAAAEGQEWRPPPFVYLGATALGLLSVLLILY